MKTRKIIFKAGYHEWDVFIDYECVYAFEDFSEDFNEDDTPEIVADMVDDLIYCMVEEKSDEDSRFYDDGFYITDEEKTELKKQMIEKLGYHYLGI
jgi:hypothetical protein